MTLPASTNNARERSVGSVMPANSLAGFNGADGADASDATEARKNNPARTKTLFISRSTDSSEVLLLKLDLKRIAEDNGVEASIRLKRSIRMTFYDQ